MKTAIISVTNDLSTDQRVHRTALALQKLDFHVVLIGRKKNDSTSLVPREYQTHRMNVLFEKGVLFYAEYNLRLFFYLLFKKMDMLAANDLDTLLPNYLISKIKNIKLVYDSHEYFTGVPELENRTFTKWIWKSIERWILPNLKYAYTVNNSIANLYKQEYNIDMRVIRNIPILSVNHSSKSRLELGLLVDKKIILYQGAGINIDRGVEEAVQAMQYIDNAIFLIVGSGDVIDKLKTISIKLELQNKIKFISKLPFEELRQYTRVADIALTLDKDTNVNYRFSLPNKLFDYIHAGVPILASPLIEVKKIIETYRVGTLIQNHDPKHIAEKINEMLSNEGQLKEWKINCKKAAEELCWQKEEKELLEIFNQ